MAGSSPRSHRTGLERHLDMRDFRRAGSPRPTWEASHKLDNATAPIFGSLQEPCMPKSHKRADALKPKGTPSDAGGAEKDAARPKGKQAAWVPANKLPGKSFDARRNLPSGQLGGSGRKTNISRSS